MDANDIFRRLSRAFAAVQALTELDLSKLPVRSVKGDGKTFLGFDESVGLTPDERETCAITAVLCVANIRDNARRWAKKNGHDKEGPSNVVSNSFYLKVINDLSNAEKHGYPPDSSGVHSTGLAPKLRRVDKSVRLQTHPKKGSWSAVTLGRNGWQAHGDGTVSLQIDGEIIDKDGNRLGSLNEFLQAGFAAWEHYFRSLGVQLV